MSGHSSASKASADNRSNQMNPNNGSYSSSRGSGATPSVDAGQAAADNRSNQMNPNNEAYSKSRGQRRRILLLLLLLSLSLSLSLTIHHDAMDCDDTASTSLTLTAVARTAKLPPKTVIKQLYDDHAISTVEGLRDMLNDTDAAKSLPPQWCQQLAEAMEKLSVASDSREGPPPFTAVQWGPNPESVGPSIIVTQGDLTTCEADAIVNPANSRLSHGGGLARVIARCGGQIIHDESQAWIRQRKSLPVGKAMVTSSGELPCRYVIHTVGPNLTDGGSSTPTQEEAQQLRNAVWSVLCEAEKLGLATIAIPGISSGAYGYPRDLAAREIVTECARFCRARTPTAKPSTPTTIRTIVLMNNDTPTCESFGKALDEAAGDSLQTFDGNPFEREAAKTPDQNQ